MNNKFIIICISVFFYLVGFGAAFGMFIFWSWLFDEGILRNIFLLITLVLLMKHTWKHTEWTLNMLKSD
jgi:hypothetical protein